MIEMFSVLPTGRRLLCCELAKPDKTASGLLYLPGSARNPDSTAVFCSIIAVGPEVPREFSSAMSDTFVIFNRNLALEIGREVDDRRVFLIDCGLIEGKGRFPSFEGNTETEIEQFLPDLQIDEGTQPKS